MTILQKEDTELKKSLKAYQELQRYRKSCTADRDYKLELVEALEEKCVDKKIEGDSLISGIFNTSNDETLAAFEEVDEMKTTKAGQRFDNLDDLWVSLEG